MQLAVRSFLQRRFPAHTRRWGSAVASALFHAGLALALAVTFDFGRLLSRPQSFDYTATEQALTQTRRALDAALAAHGPSPLEPFLAEALERGRPELARGLLLGLAAGEAEGDADRLAQISRGLPEALRAELQRPPSAQEPPRFTQVIVAPAADGEVRSYAAEELRQQLKLSARWLLGQPVDELSFELSGLRLAAPMEDPLAGEGAHGEAIALLKAARRAAKLTPAMEAHLRARLLAALPPDRLQANLIAAFQGPMDSAAPLPIAEAFRNSLSAPDAAPLWQDLEHLAAARRALGAAPTLELLAQLERPEDLPRLRLLAEAGGERAPALVELTSLKEALRAARGRLRLTPQVSRNFLGYAIALAFLLLGAAGAVAAEGRALGPIGAAPEAG